MPTFAQAIDAMLEWAVVTSFTRIGYVVRRRAAHWRDLSSYDLAGHAAVVTGATSGIGYAAALQLVRMGAHVVLVGRDVARTEAAAARLRAAVPVARGGTSAVIASMDDAAAIRRAAAEILTAHRRLDILVHNAGALAHRYEQSPMGVEVTVATQVAGPFLLTGLLLDRLAASSGRVIFVSSGGAYLVPLSVSALEPEAAGFDGTRHYALAKRAQITLAALWTERLGGRGPAFHAMHPGWVDTPGLADQLPWFRRLLRPLLRTPAEGADTIAWLAADAAGATSQAAMWFDRVPRPVHRLARTRRADTAERRGRLWRWCVSVTGWSVDASAVGGG